MWLHFVCGIGMLPVGMSGFSLMFEKLQRAERFHAFVLFIIGVLGAHWFWAEVARPRPVNARLVLDMTVPTSDKPAWTGLLYVNSWKEKPLEFLVKPGTRSQYEFPINSSTITFLRLDPAQVQGIEVAIHSLTLESRGKLVHRFTPEELAQWPRHVQDGGRLEKDAFYLSSVKTVNHMAVWSAPIEIPDAEGSRAWWTPIPREWPFRLLLVLVFGLVVAILLGGGSQPGRTHLILCTATLMGVLVGISVVSTWFRGSPFPPSLAVGLATYAGYRKTADTLMLLPLIIIPVAVALAAWKIRQHWQTIIRGAETLYRKILPVLSGDVGHALVLGPISAAVLVSSVWGAAYQAEVLAQRAYSGAWDSGNYVLWSYLSQHGFAPYRDFWFPYGGQIFRYMAFPVDFLFARLFGATVLLLALSSFYLITNRSLARTVAIFALWFGLYTQNVFPVTRYAVFVPIILSYIAISHAPRRIGPAHYVFWAAFALGLVDDLMTIAYTGICITLVLCLEATQDRAAFFHDPLRRLRRDFLVPLCLVFSLSVILAWNGQLGGLVNFLSWDVGGMTAYAATPAFVKEWLRMDPVDRGFFLWAGPLLLGMGLYLYLTASREHRKVPTAILTLGACSLILFYKPLVHQDPAFGWLSVPTAGCLFLFLGRGETLNRAQRLFLFVAGGLLLGSFWSSGVLADIGVRTFPGTITLKKDIKALWRSSEQRARDLQATWDAKNFKQQSELLAVLEAIQPRLTKANATSLFALSDEQPLYVMARQKPPYYATLYDGSPLHAQQKTVRWIEENRPPVVVYNVTKTHVFGVPAPVRAPLIFQEVILNYVSDLRVGNYAILRPRKPGEAVDLAFWQEVLGPASLGHLPQYSSVERFKPCADASGRACAEFLAVTLRTPVQAPGEMRIPVIVGDRRFEINFATEPEQKVYAVYLDRVWFWGPLRRAGLAPALAGTVTEANVEIVRRAPEAGILW